MAKNKKESPYLHRQDEWKALYESGLSYTAIGKQYGVSYPAVQTVLRDVVTTRPKKQFDHLVTEWVDYYVNHEWPITQIGKKYSVDPNTVSKYLKKEGVEMRKKSGRTSPHEADIPAWIQMYKDGLSLKEIADDYATFPQTVHKHIKERIDMRAYTETSRIFAVEHPSYFKELDSHEKAYWLGIWYGTGFNSRSVGGYQSTLVISAREQLTVERFKKVIGYEKPLDVVKDESGGIVKLRIFSKSIYDDLASHGLREDKLSHMKIPKTLPSEFYSSFLLGYYEGKSSCYVSEQPPYKQIRFSLFGKKAFLHSVQALIHEKTGVDLKCKLTHHVIDQREPFDVYKLETSSRGKIAKIASWLYSGNSTYSPHRDIRQLLKQL